MTRTSAVYYPGPWHVGGAESYVLNIGRALAAHGPVSILSISRPEPSVLEKLRLPEAFDPEWRLGPCSQSSVREMASGADIFVNCSPWDYPVPPSGALSALVAYYAPELRDVAAPGRLARRAAALLQAGRRVWPAPRAAISRYDRVLGVSQWTAQLIAERWGREAGVFYPAVRPVPARAKERLILTVGRIAAGGTRKGHLDLVDAFLRSGLEGWRLAVAGAVNYVESNAAVEAWRQELEGAPVDLVANPTKEQLEDLYGRASLYWHGAGFGAPSGSVGREHFGISVVEAMSAGAVPVAFQGGGVREIVTSGVDGVLWSTLDDLIEATTRLARDDGERERLRRAATERASYFGIEQHDRRVEELLVPPRGDRQRSST